MKNNLILKIALVLVLLVLAACGGGGSSAPPAGKTTATVTLNLTGSLPQNGAIAGATCTLVLPANVTPQLTNGLPTGVVSLAGVMAGSTISPLVSYTPAGQNTPGSLDITIASSALAGVTQVGNIATVTLQLANGAEPAANAFSVTNDQVADANLGGTGVINGMGVGIAGVTLQ
ncbi:hypothetical protein GMLC_12930 [Geomonas limicola]|uniref:Lipoprotein n=1 Tax=Geomonas limicola TaxID=2740186 RepID=A0A6V8N705_9BACT|nr:hypothetical protein [Geomonas limicola]GFO67714.1 hypothetical protein GMLC_12930 [Geomonas limicola]